MIKGKVAMYSYAQYHTTCANNTVLYIFSRSDNQMIYACLNRQPKNEYDVQQEINKEHFLIIEL